MSAASGQSGRAGVARLALPLLASLSLGLAPFFPEPHLIGKLLWVAGGAQGMALMDWLDLAFHGAPWAWLLGEQLALVWRQRVRTPPPS